MKAALLIASLVAGSLAVKCYVCQSRGDCGSKGTDCSCQDPYEPKESHLVDCSTHNDSINNGGCTKSKGGAKVFGSWYYDVWRSCGQVADNAYCKNAIMGKSPDPNNPADKTQYDWEAFNCSCAGNRCNSGVETSVPVGVLLCER